MVTYQELARNIYRYLFINAMFAHCLHTGLLHHTLLTCWWTAVQVCARWHAQHVIRSRARWSAEWAGQLTSPVRLLGCGITHLHGCRPVPAHLMLSMLLLHAACASPSKPKCICPLTVFEFMASSELLMGESGRLLSAEHTVACMDSARMLCTPAEILW